MKLLARRMLLAQVLGPGSFAEEAPFA